MSVSTSPANGKTARKIRNKSTGGHVGCATKNSILGNGMPPPSRERQKTPEEIKQERRGAVMAFCSNLDWTCARRLDLEVTRIQ